MEKRNPSKLDPYESELLAMRIEEGLSFRDMEAAMKTRRKERVSYRTIQNWFQKNYPELIGERDHTDTGTPAHSVSASPQPGTRPLGSDAPVSPPAEDLATLQARLDALTKAHRALQDRNAAQEAEIITLTEQRPVLEAKPSPRAELHAPIDRGDWEGEMFPLAADDAWQTPLPVRYTGAPPRRSMRRWYVLGLVLVLLGLALWLLLTYTSLLSATPPAKPAGASKLRRATPPSPSWLASTWATLPYTVSFYLTYWQHTGFVLVEAGVCLAGMALGARGKTPVLALLALLLYLALLHAHWPAFAIILLLTLRVATYCLRPR